MKHLLFLVALFGSIVVSAQSGWIKIGEKMVGFKSDTDKVTLVGNERDINRVKIKCTQGTLQLKSVNIVMDNGKSKRYDAKAGGMLTNGMSSAAYDVPDKNDKVKYVEFQYDTKGMIGVTKRSKIEILGKKD